MVKMCPFLEFFRWGMQYLEATKVALWLRVIARSYLLTSVSSTGVLYRAETLLMRMSMPPKVSTVFLTAASICLASLQSQTIGRALPPAASMALAAV